MSEAYLKAIDIYKDFGHVQALRGVSVSAYKGEVLAIAGDNGAGKSTLIKMFSGVLKPDRGYINIDGKSYGSLNTRTAIEAGVSTVYQDLALGNTMDVTSNLFLGNEISRFGFLKKKEMKKEAERILKDLDIQIPDVTVPVGDLSGGQRQGVAVARLINRGGQVFIFDEPTAAMGVNETRAVIKLIRKLASDGYAVIIISHNMPQVLEVSDRICIMRQGRVIAELKTKETNLEEVISMITGSYGYGSIAEDEIEK